MTINDFSSEEELTLGEAMSEDCTGSRRISLFARLIPIRMPMLVPDDYELLLTLRGAGIRGVLFSSSDKRIYGAGVSVLIMGNDIAETSECRLISFRHGKTLAETKNPDDLHKELLRFVRSRSGKSNEYFRRLAHPEAVKFAED